MKKELKKLLESQNGEMSINKHFKIRRWSKDALENSVDKLVLVSSLFGYERSIELKNRIIEDLIQEIQEEMAKECQALQFTLTNDFKNGYLY